MKYVSYVHSSVIRTLGTLEFIGYQFLFCYYIYILLKETTNLYAKSSDQCEVMANYGFYVFGMGLILYYEFYSVVIVIASNK